MVLLSLSLSSGLSELQCAKIKNKICHFLTLINNLLSGTDHLSSGQARLVVFEGKQYIVVTGHKGCVGALFELKTV